MTTGSTVPGPRRVAVVGAGMVGLSTAWFLQEHGIDVTVLDGDGVAAGSSWGNAGWLTPGLTTPLPEPAVLAYGLRAVVSASSPVYVPLRPDPRLLRFLGGFVRHSTARRWRTAMQAYAPVNALALEAFDTLGHGGVDVPVRRADPFLACFASAEERAHLLGELEQIGAAGQAVGYEPISGDEARAHEPTLSGAVGAAVRVHGQRFVDPPRFVQALAASVTGRGGRVLAGRRVVRLRDEGGVVRVVDATGAVEVVDAVVVANGAWLGGLANRFGVRRVVQAGRGYSFSVTGARLPSGPVYFPAQRIACTPLESDTEPRLRVAGMMEFRSPEAPLDDRRVRAMVGALAPFLDDVDLEDRADEWVGSRPCTPDGLPLVGATRSPRVFVAGGHGMWGMVLGPVTGRLLAQRIVTGADDPLLAPFDPLR